MIERRGGGHQTARVPRYRVLSMTGEYLGQIESKTPNVGRGDVVELPNGRDAIVTDRAETIEDGIEALLQVAAAPSYGSSTPWTRRAAAVRS